MAKIPVGRTIAHAYRFAFGDFFKILGVMWLPLTIGWMPGILMRDRITALSAQMAARDFSGLRDLLPFLVPFYLTILVLMFMQVVGIAKLALGMRKGPSWFYFSLGKPVWRLIGSFLLLIVAMVLGWIAIILGGIFLAFLIGLLAKLVSNAIVGWILAALTAGAVIALWCGYAYCLVRLTFLLAPVVAAEKEGFALAHSWTLGRGNFWRSFAIILAVFLPFLALELFLLFGYLFKGVPFPPAHATAEQAATFQAVLNTRSLEMTNLLYHYWYISFPLFIAVLTLFYGTTVGVQCFAYRALMQGEASAPAAAD